MAGPEDEDGEEVRTGDEGYQQYQDENAWFFFKPGWKRNEERSAEEQRHENVGGSPAVLVASPVETANEEESADDGEKASYKVDLGKHFAASEAS